MRLDFAGTLFERQRAALALLLLGTGVPETDGEESSARSGLEAQARQSAGQNAISRSVSTAVGRGMPWEAGTGFQDALERAVAADSPSGAVEAFDSFDDAQAVGAPSWNGFPLPKHSWTLDGEYAPQDTSDGLGTPENAMGFRGTAEGSVDPLRNATPASKAASVRLGMLRPKNGDVPADSYAVWTEMSAVQRDSGIKQMDNPDAQKDSGTAGPQVEWIRKRDPANMTLQMFQIDNPSALQDGDVLSSDLLLGSTKPASPFQNQARALSAAFQRDARRYDGGFTLF